MALGFGPLSEGPLSALPPVAATGAYTLTAATGSFAITGVDAGLRAARTLTGGTGSYAITGVAAGLRVGRKIPAAVGAYSITGVNVGLRAARTLTGGTGVFAITGVAANLVYIRSYRITAETGVFTITGQPAALTYVAVTVNVPSSPYGGGARRDSGTRRGSAKIKRISEDTIREAYNKAMGIEPTASIPIQVRKAVKAAVRRHALEDALVPGLPVPAEAIDWPAIMADNAAIEAFRGLIARIARDEEDAIIALLLAA